MVNYYEFCQTLIVEIFSLIFGGHPTISFLLNRKQPVPTAYLRGTIKAGRSHSDSSGSYKTDLTKNLNFRLKRELKKSIWLRKRILPFHPVF